MQPISTSFGGLPRPILKWAGGKRQLLASFVPFLPREFNTYIEPFVGGGALFFHLRPDKSVLIDNNPELMNVYNVIKHDVHELIASLKHHKNEKSYYYAIRDMDRDKNIFEKLSDVERASRTIYMNHVCFNGLYRVNRRGEFNVPFGQYTSPLICDEANLLVVHDILQDVKLVTGNFDLCLEHARAGDFVYFDPPYVPLSVTSSFTSYTSDAFDQVAQQALYNVFKALDARGCKVMLSNSHCDFVLDLYKEYRVETIMASRAINCNAERRGKIKEVLVLNDFS